MVLVFPVKTLQQSRHAQHVNVASEEGLEYLLWD